MMINNELDKISEWLTVNQLSLNVPKQNSQYFIRKGKTLFLLK